MGPLEKTRVSVGTMTGFPVLLGEGKGFEVQGPEPQNINPKPQFVSCKKTAPRPTVLAEVRSTIPDVHA